MKSSLLTGFLIIAALGALVFAVGERRGIFPNPKSMLEENRLEKIKAQESFDSVGLVAPNNEDLGLKKTTINLAGLNGENEIDAFIQLLGAFAQDPSAPLSKAVENNFNKIINQLNALENKPSTSEKLINEIFRFSLAMESSNEVVAILFLKFHSKLIGDLKVAIGKLLSLGFDFFPQKFLELYYQNNQLTKSPGSCILINTLPAHMSNIDSETKTNYLIERLNKLKTLISNKQISSALVLEFTNQCINTLESILPQEPQEPPAPIAAPISEGESPNN